MKLLALVLGFVIERFATRLLHLREFRLFDPLFDFGQQQGNNRPRFIAILIAVCLIAIPSLPVVGIHMWLDSPSIAWNIAYSCFALLVVFLCLGPRDLGNEVDEYCAALDQGDAERAQTVLLELREVHTAGNEVEVVENAIFMQAPNRVYGVVFWFIVLGPVGAWLFRVSDLCRRRLTYEVSRNPSHSKNILAAIDTIHGLLLWIPVRLAALGYALTGSFDEAYVEWRKGLFVGKNLQIGNDQLAAAVGRAAMSGVLDEPENSSQAARNAMRIVTRTLGLWMIVIALITLFGWAL